MKKENLISEGVMDWVMIYQLLKRLGIPFEKWEAFKVGIIDATGKRLREPTPEERSTVWGYFDRVVWNIKKIITKFTGHSQLTAAIVSLYLLKEGMQPKNIKTIIEKTFNAVDILDYEKINLNESKANYKIIEKELI